MSSALADLMRIMTVTCSLSLQASLARRQQNPSTIDERERFWAEGVT
jgi:hypothetical protein